MINNDISVTFTPSHVLKHSRENRNREVFEYLEYPDKKLCVVNCLHEYLKRRAQKVKDSMVKLLITYKKPYHEVSVDTIRRWVKKCLHNANIFNFSAHSCRSASTSKAKTAGLDIDLIMRKACWKNAQTFYKHYNKVIISDIETLNCIIEE